MFAHTHSHFLVPRLALLFWHFSIFMSFFYTSGLPLLIPHVCLCLFFWSNVCVCLCACVCVFVCVCVCFWLRQQRMWVFAQMHSQIIKRYIKSHWWQNLHFRYERVFLRLLFPPQLFLFSLSLSLVQTPCPSWSLILGTLPHLSRLVPFFSIF